MLSNEILRFLNEIEIEVTGEITIFIFTFGKNGLFINSVLPKGFKCSILV